jgi:hypothetical protein
MKLHHAATLALVGWYLMYPPINGKAPNLYVDSAASLSRWDIENFYGSKAKCDHWKAIWNSDEAWRTGANSHPPMRAAFAKSLCVSADDPRIKENRDIGHFTSGHWKPYLDGRPN